MAEDSISDGARVFNCLHDVEHFGGGVLAGSLRALVVGFTPHIEWSDNRLAPEKRDLDCS